jgi:hypothetical protein
MNLVLCSQLQGSRSITTTSRMAVREELAMRKLEVFREQDNRME